MYVLVLFCALLKLIIGVTVACERTTHVDQLSVVLFGATVLRGLVQSLTKHALVSTSLIVGCLLCINA